MKTAGTRAKRKREDICAAIEAAETDDLEVPMESKEGLTDQEQLLEDLDADEVASSVNSAEITNLSDILSLAAEEKNAKKVRRHKILAKAAERNAHVDSIHAQQEAKERWEEV